MQREKVGVVFTWAGKNNAHNGENGAKSLDILRGLRERGTCAYKNESSWQQRYGTMASKQRKEQVKKGDAQNAADNKGNKIGACRISEDFPGRDIVFAYLRQESDI